VTIDDYNIIIDFGQDFARQLIENKIEKIDYAFLTHAHDDHCSGFSQFSVAENCIIESPRDVWKRLGARVSWLRRRNKNVELRDFTPKVINGVHIDTIKLVHQKDYKRQGKADPCYGYILHSDNFTFAYCTDFNDILEPEKLEKLDLLISDGNGWDNDGKGHVGINGSLRIFERFKPKRMLLTHIPHRIEHTQLLEYLEKYRNVEPAYDGLEINVIDYKLNASVSRCSSFSSKNKHKSRN